MENKTLDWDRFRESNSGDLKSENSLLEQTLQLLCDCSDLSHLHLPLQQIEESAMISSIASKREVIVNKQERTGVPQIIIRIRMSGIILEYTGKSTFKKSEEQKSLDKDLSEAIREQLQAIVSHVQSSGGDNCGIGTYVRNSMSYEKWNNLNWKSIYPRADIRVEVDTTIRDYGMIR